MKLAILAGNLFGDELARSSDYEAYIVKQGETLESGQLLEYNGEMWIVNNPMALLFEEICPPPVFTAGVCVRLVNLSHVALFRTDVDLSHPMVTKHPCNVSDGMTLYTVNTNITKGGR